MTLTIGTRVKVLHRDQLIGDVTATMTTSPTTDPKRTVRVTFDNPHVYGGYGEGWFDPDNLERL